MDRVVEKELKFLNFLQSKMRTNKLDKIMVFITSLGDWGFIWLALCLFMFFIPKFRNDSYTFALAIFLNALICNVILKPLCHRKRPFDLSKDIKLLVKSPTDYSFPSGHTTASFTAAAVIFNISVTAGIIVVVLALLIGFSRMYLFLHFPSDVLVGGILGIIIAIIAINIMDNSVVQELKYIGESYIF